MTQKSSGNERDFLETRSERNPSNYKLKNISVIALKLQNRFMNMKLYVFIRLKQCFANFPGLVAKNPSPLKFI